MKKIQVKKSIRKGKNKASVVKPHTRSIIKSKKSKNSIVKKRIGLSNVSNTQKSFKENLKSIVYKTLG